MTFSILEQQELLRGRVFKVVRETVQYPDGRVATKDLVRHNGAVVILPRHNDGRLVLVRQYRHATGGMFLEFPAGTLEIDESPIACAKREIIEETGFAASDWKDLGTLYPAPGFCDEKQFFYYAENLTEAFAEMDEDELIEVVLLTIEEVEARIRNDEFRDGKSLAIYTRAKLQGLLG